MSDGIVRLTRQQVREVDRRAIEQYHVPGIVLMENAARGAVATAWSAMDETPGPVTVICGGGNNGGDGLALARHLHNSGLPVQILLTIDPAKYTGDALTNWRIVQAMNLLIAPFSRNHLFDTAPSLIVDAIFGTGLTQAPRDPFPEIAAAISETSINVLAIDLPSGMDCDTGFPLGPASIRARDTVTFVAEKAGFANPAARKYTGHVTVADIGCPRQIVDEVLRALPAP
jgi:NAD(P)H-hydrate epimerase